MEVQAFDNLPEYLIATEAQRPGEEYQADRLALLLRAYVVVLACRHAAAHRLP